MKKKRLLFLLPLITMASCGNSVSSSSSSRPYSGPGYSTSKESTESEPSSEEPSSSSSLPSSTTSKRQKAYDELKKIEDYQTSSSFVDPKETKYSGNGRAKVSSINADLTFGYDKTNEYFHVTVSTGLVSYDRWIYKKKSSRNTYIYNVYSLTKTYTRTAYTSSAFENALNDCIPYEPVRSIVDSMYSYQVGKDILDSLGSTYEESSIASEKYTYGDEGDMSATIKVNDGENNDFTETFAYSDYLGTTRTIKGTVSGAEVNTSTNLDFSYCDISDLPNLYDYTESGN